MADLITIDCGGEDPDARIRRQWAESLRQHLAVRGMTRKQFHLALAQRGLEVTPQAVSSWLTGRVSPRPHAQVVIASVLQVPPRSLFALEAVA